MEAPRAPRKPIICVDHQLEEFETSLRSHITYAIGRNVNTDYWFEVDAMNREVRDAVFAAVNVAIDHFGEQYALATPVMNLLEHLRILIQHVTWASVNVPFPHDPSMHLGQVVDNAIQVYIDVVYAHLRTEMIMVNHNATVLQRTWRRCIADPYHPACRRRLEYEFHGAIRDLNSL